jgi:hypothetical protein
MRASLQVIEVQEAIQRQIALGVVVHVLLDVVQLFLAELLAVAHQRKSPQGGLGPALLLLIEAIVDLGQHATTQRCEVVVVTIPQPLDAHRVLLISQRDVDVNNKRAYAGIPLLLHGNDDEPRRRTKIWGCTT